MVALSEEGGIMTEGPTGALLVTSWHMPSTRAWSRLVIPLRRLERRSCWLAPGWVRSHRWSSRRSLLLTSWWTTSEAAEAWMASDAFRAFDARARRLGARAYVELRGAG
jgi:hypothetical protein